MNANLTLKIASLFALLGNRLTKWPLSLVYKHRFWGDARLLCGVKMVEKLNVRTIFWGKIREEKGLISE